MPSISSKITEDLNPDKELLINNNLDTNYFQKIPKNDYILGEGDLLKIKVSRDYPELDTLAAIDGEGTIYLPRLNRIYISGLSIKELNLLLNESFKEFIKYPSAEVEIEKYRSIKVLVNGEVSKPGLRTLEGEVIVEYDDYKENSKKLVPNEYNQIIQSQITKTKQFMTSEDEQESIYSKSQDRNKASIYFPTIIDAIRESGGLTEYSNLTNIEVIRRNNISLGGGKIKATINIEGIFNSTDDSQNIRIYDGDIINIKKSITPNEFLLKKGMQANINPSIISVLVAGRVKSPGITKVFRDSTLNDAIDLAGGAKIIKGPIRYLRLKNDSTVDKRKFKYSRNHRRGSYKNPYLNDGDMIIIGESALSVTSEVITAFTKPFTGLFSTYGIIKAISD